jgi:hypothetical protein
VRRAEVEEGELDRTAFEAMGAAATEPTDRELAFSTPFF